MRYSKQKLALFLTAQALAVAVMIALYQAARDPDCAWVNDCAGRPLASILLAIAMLLGELTVLAVALRTDQPVWYALVGLGLVSLVTAFVFGIAAIEMRARNDLPIVMAIWHVLIGLVLLMAGTAAAFWRLLEKLRRPDTQLPEDLQSSAMWPLD